MITKQQPYRVYLYFNNNSKWCIQDTNDIKYAESSYKLLKAMLDSNYLASNIIDVKLEVEYDN